MTDGGLGFLLPEIIREELLSSALSATPLGTGPAPTPEQIAASKQRREEAREAMLREHRFLLEDVPRGGLAEDMLTLHAPNRNGRCDGCNFDGYEAEPPEWPCTTYQHTAVRYGRRFVEDQYGDWRMERAT